MPVNTVRVARPSEFGNPYQFQRHEIKRSVLDLGGLWEWWIEGHEPVVYRASGEAEARAKVVELYRLWINSPPNRTRLDRAKFALRGKNLACWCPLDKPCHADVMLELANL